MTCITSCITDRVCTTCTTGGYVFTLSNTGVGVPTGQVRMGGRGSPGQVWTGGTPWWGYPQPGMGTPSQVRMGGVPHDWVAPPPPVEGWRSPPPRDTTADGVLDTPRSEFLVHYKAQSYKTWKMNVLLNVFFLLRILHQHVYTREKSLIRPSTVADPEGVGNL